MWWVLRVDSVGNLGRNRYAVGVKLLVLEINCLNVSLGLAWYTPAKLNSPSRLTITGRRSAGAATSVLENTVTTSPGRSTRLWVSSFSRTALPRLNGIREVVRSLRFRRSTTA